MIKNLIFTILFLLLVLFALSILDPLSGKISWYKKLTGKVVDEYQCFENSDCIIKQTSCNDCIPDKHCVHKDWEPICEDTGPLSCPPPKREDIDNCRCISNTCRDCIGPNCLPR